MPQPDADTTDRLLAAVHDHAARYLHGLDGRPVRATASVRRLRAALDGPLPDDGADPVAVVDALAHDAHATMAATTSARYFGFVVGGAAARGDGGGHAHARVGPERRVARRRSTRGDRRGGRADLARRPAEVSQPTRRWAS